MKVFGFTLSPFVRKVHLVAAEKGIAIETVQLNPANPPSEFLAASPFRKIPALLDGDFSICDSTAIATYLEGVQPEPLLFPGDAKQKAKAIWFEEFADTIFQPVGGKIVFNRFVSPKFLRVPGDEELSLQGEAEIVPILDYIESVAPADGWFTGAALSIGDVAVAAVFRSLSYVGYAPDSASHPKTAAWYARVGARPSWQGVIAREEALLAAWDARS